MKLNLAKNKVLLFNRTIVFDFIPEFNLDNTEIETVEEMKWLDLMVRNDISWKANTDAITQKINC